jgi:hypothetical protein
MLHLKVEATVDYVGYTADFERKKVELDVAGVKKLSALAASAAST